MKPDELQPMLARAIRSVLPEKLPWTPPPEAKFVTGNPRWDAQLHHVLVEYGVEVEFSKQHGVIGYRVVDEKKFIMFMLRWS